MELVKVGEPVQIALTLYPTSNLFMPGHRIRLDVPSSRVVLPVVLTESACV